jgi:ubiquinol-cytochrome c reductase cytochrome b subunit
MYPVFAAKTGAFFMMVFGMCAALGGLAQINPIWSYGPYDPSQVSAASQPDWYVGFLDGSTRLFLPWEIRVFGVTVSPLFWPAIVFAGIVFTLLMVYPWLEAKLTGDHDYHNLLDKPRDNPKRTGLGAMALSFYAVLVISGGNDVIATTFRISLNTMTWAGRIGLFVVPPIAYYITKRVCEALQRHDHELVEHGIETGIVRQLPSGEFVEVTIPKPVPKRIELTPVPPDDVTSHDVKTKGGVLDRAGRAMKDFFVERGEEEGEPTPEEEVGGRRH